MSGIEPEGGTQHGSLKVGAGAGALGDSDFMGQTVFFFSFQERPAQFWPRPRLKLKRFESWLRL